jgi:hypothetical protein
MLIFPVGVLSGLTVGRLRGGRLAGLAGLRLQGLPLLWLAVALQLALGAVAPSARPLGVGLSYALVGAWLSLNTRRATGAVRAAMALLALGWLLNLVPMALNGGMPVSGHALRAVGAPVGTTVDQGHLFKHVPADARTRMAVLGDVIPVPVPASVISVGDVAMLLGVAGLVMSGMTRADQAVAEPDAAPLSSSRCTGG